MSNRTVGIGSSLLVAASVALLLGGAVNAADKNSDKDRGRDRGLDCSSNADDRGAGKLRVVGLTSDSVLVCFTERSPDEARRIGTVAGLTGDTALVGIDFRVQDGLLYGVGNAGGVYTLDTSNATATIVSRLTVALSGTSFGVDFNPAADRLRIVSDNGQNLRHNVNAGGVTLVDGALNYVAGTPTLGVESVAYANNDLDVLTGTTLFGLDTTLDQIALQSPPNAGSLVATGKLTLDAAAVAGFDVYSRLDKGVTVSNAGYAVMNVEGTARLYRVNTLTGKASSVGRFKTSVVDIAVPLNQ